MVLVSLLFGSFTLIAESCRVAGTVAIRMVVSSLESLSTLNSSCIIELVDSISRDGPDMP